MRSVRPVFQKEGTTMREINNSTGNINPANFQKVDQRKEQTPPAEIIQETAEPKPVTDNLSNSPEAIIGRSQVHNADNLENDMKTMLNNPEAIEKAVKFCTVAERVLREQGVEAPYEKAAVLANAFKDEFISK